ncbi:MAG: DNA polymerase I [Burkholderiales bacterium]|nr:DNA polymerase I [Burkholderiales bacterium]
MDKTDAVSEPVLLLVDGSSYLYRAFHALPELRSPAGEPTGALYGVINMLRRLRREVPARYAACVFDAKGKTFRDELYPQYKAQRPPMPPELAAQLEPLHETIAALGWPLVVIEGVEADDVIATLARAAAQAGIRTIISSGDKDLCQLVDDRITVIDTMSNKTYDVAGVIERFGVTPAQVLDWLTLVGDAVDNIPGVDKVGPKTAAKWLNEYGSLDQLLARAHELKGVAGENLRAARDWLPQARRLLAVRTDVELPFGPQDLAWRPPAQERLLELFTRYGFRSWLSELSAAATTPAPAAMPERRYETLLQPADLERWLQRLDTAPLACLDTETTALDPLQARLVGLSFSVEAGVAAYLPLAHRYPGAPAQLDPATVLARLKPWLEDADRPKVGHNLKYDWHVLMNHGIRLRGIAHDTLLQSYVLEAHERHDMDSLAERHLHETTLKYEEVCGKGANQIGFDQVEIGRATAYAAEDADITLRLHHALHPRIRAEQGLDFVYHRIEMPLMPVLARMERTGVLIDTALLARHSQALAQQMQALEAKAHEAAGEAFNLGSTKQLAEILYGRLGLPVLKKTPKGAPSTDEEVLEKLALDYPLARILLDWRALAKLKSTYTDKLPQMVDPATGRVHTTYAQATAVTGRLASVEPNLQNIPVRTPEGRKIREAFIAAPGYLVLSADYSQVELRIMAHLSADARLIQAFAEDADIHRATAAEVLGIAPEAVTPEQRRMAKAVNFGLIYGMSAYGLAAQLNIERTQAQAYIDRYFARYPGVARYMEATREQARQRGYVETLFGRRLYLPEIASGNPARRQGAERAAINAPMQGTAADLIKLAMIAVQDWLDREGMSSRLILQVHDELVLEVAQDELERVKTQLPQLMCGVAQLRVPLKVELGVGPNWDAAH